MESMALPIPSKIIIDNDDKNIYIFSDGSLHLQNQPAYENIPVQTADSYYQPYENPPNSNTDFYYQPTSYENQPDPTNGWYYSNNNYQQYPPILDSSATTDFNGAENRESGGTFNPEFEERLQSFFREAVQKSNTQQEYDNKISLMRNIN